MDGEIWKDVAGREGAEREGKNVEKESPTVWRGV